MILLRAVLVALLVSKGLSVICGDKTCDSTGCLAEIDKNGKNCDVQCMNITSTNNCTEEENGKLQCFCNGEDCHRKENTISEWKSMVVNFTKPNEIGKCMDRKRAEKYWKCGDVNCSGTSESCHFEIEDQNESDPKCKIQCLPDHNNITSETSCANGTDNNFNCYCKGSHCDKQRETINKWRDAVNLLTTDKDKIERNMDHCLHKKGVIVTHCGSDNCTKSNDNSCKMEVNKGGNVCDVQCSEKDSSVDECLESDDKQKMECFCKTDDCHTARTTIDNWRNGAIPEFSEGLGTCLSGKGLIVTQCGEDKCPPGRDRSCRIEISAAGSNCTVACSSEDSLVNECRDHPSNATVRECFCRTNDCHLHGTTIESWRTSIISVSSGASFKLGLETCLLEKEAVVKSCGGTACQGSEDKSCRIDTNSGGDICTLGCSAETGSRFGCFSPADQNTTANSTVQCFCKRNDCDKNGDIIEKWRTNVNSSFSGGLETCLLNQNSIVTSCGGNSCSVKGVDKSCRIEVNKETNESKVECSSKGIVKEKCGLLPGSNDTMECFCHSNDCDRSGSTIEAWRTFFSPDERKNFSNIFENYLYEQGSIVKSCGETKCDGPKDKSCRLVNNVQAADTCSLECSAEDGSDRKCTPTSEEGFACLCKGKDCYMRAETVDKWREQTRNGTVEFRDRFANCLHSSNAIVRKCGSQNCTAVGQDKSCRIKVDNGNTCEIGCSDKDPLVDECRLVAGEDNAMECVCKKDDCHMIGTTIETWRTNLPLQLETQLTQCLHNQGAIVRQCGAESCVNGTDKSCRIELDTNGVNCKLGCSKEDSLVDKCRKVEGNSTLFECFCKTDNCHLHGTTIDEWRKSQEGIDGTFNDGVTRCLRQKGSLVEFCGVGTITECTSHTDKSCMMESSTTVDACNVKCSKETGPKEGGCTITGNQTTTSNSTIRCFCRTNNCDRDGAIIEQWRSSVKNISSSIGTTISPVGSTTSPASVITNFTNLTTITLAGRFETCLYTKHAIVKSCGGVECTGMNDKSCKIEVNGSEAKCDVTCSSEGIVEEKCRTAAGNNNTVECFCNTNDCDQKGTTIDNWRSLMTTDELKNLTESFNSCLYKRDVIVKSCGGNKCTRPADKSCRVKSDENGGQCNIECSDKESLKPYCKTDSPNDPLHCFCGGKDCYENFETINQWRNQTRQEDSLKKFEGGFNECLYSEGVMVQKCGHNQCTNSEFIKSCKMTVDRGEKCAIECVNEDPLADECRPGDNSTLECFCKKDDCHTHTSTIESWRNMSKSLGEELDSCLYKKEAIVKQCGAETCVNGTDMSCRIEVNRDGAICNLGCSKEHSSVDKCRKVEGNNAEVHECFCKTDDCHLIGTTIDAWRASSEKLNRYFENGVTKCLREKDSLVQFCGVDSSVGCPASADKSCMMRSNGNGTTCEVVCSEETGPKEGGCATTVNQTTTENSTIQCFCRTNNCDRDGAVIEQWRNSVKNITSSLKTAANSTLAEGFETCLLSEHAIVKSCAGKTCSPKNDKSCKIEVNGMESKCEVTCSSEGIVKEMCRTAARNNNTIECFCNTDDCDQKGTTTANWRTLIDKEEGLKNFTEPFKSCLYKRDVIVEKCGTNTCTMVNDKSCRIEADKNGNSCELTCSAHDGSNKLCTAHPHTGNIQCLCNGKDCYKRSETVNQWINQTKDKDALKKLNGGLITCLNTQGAIVRKCGNHNCTDSGKIKSCQLTIDQGKNCEVECSDEDPLVDECRPVAGNNNTMKCFCKKDDCHTHGTTIESWRNSSHLLKAELQTCLHNQGAVVTRCGGIECSNGTDKSCRIGFNSDGDTCDVGCSDEDSFVDDCRKDEKNHNLVECYCKTDDCHLNVELIEKWRASTTFPAHSTHRDGFEKCLHEKGSIVTRCGNNDCQGEDDKSCELQTNVNGDVCEIKCSPKTVPTETCTHGNDTSNSTIHCFCKQDNCETHGSIIETWRGNTKHSEYSAGLETCLYNKSVIVKSCGGHKCTNGEDKSCRIGVNEEKEECNVGCSSEGILTDMCRVSPLNNKTIECFCKKDDCDQEPTTIENWRIAIKTEVNQLKNFSAKFEDCLHTKGAIVKSCGGKECETPGQDKSCKIEKISSCAVKCSPERGSELGCTWDTKDTFKCFCKKDNCDKNATVIEKWREESQKQNQSITLLNNCLVEEGSIVESCGWEPCTAPNDKSCQIVTNWSGRICKMSCSPEVGSENGCETKPGIRQAPDALMQCFCKKNDCDRTHLMIENWRKKVNQTLNAKFSLGLEQCLKYNGAIVKKCGDATCSDGTDKSCLLDTNSNCKLQCSQQVFNEDSCNEHKCHCRRDDCHKDERTIAEWRKSLPTYKTHPKNALEQCLKEKGSIVKKCGDETCTIGNDTSCKVEFSSDGLSCNVGCSSETGFDGKCTWDDSGVLNCYCKSDHCDKNGTIIERWRTDLQPRSLKDASTGLEICLRNKSLVVPYCGGHKCEFGKDKSCKIETKANGQSCTVQCSAEFEPLFPSSNDVCSKETTDGNSTVKCLCRGKKDCDSDSTVIDEWRKKVEQMNDKPKLKEVFEQCLYDRNVLVHSCGVTKCSRGADKSCRMSVDEKRNECKLECSDVDVLNKCRLTTDNKTIECFCQKDKCHLNANTIEGWRSSVNTGNNQLQNFTAHLEHCLHEKKAIVRLCGTHPCDKPKDKSCQFNVNPWTESEPSFCSAETAMTNDKNECNKVSYSSLQCFCREDNCDKKGTTIEAWKKSANDTLGPEFSEKFDEKLREQGAMVKNCGTQTCDTEQRSCSIEIKSGANCETKCSNKDVFKPDCTKLNENSMQCFCERDDCHRIGHVIDDWRNVANRTATLNTFTTDLEDCLRYQGAIVTKCGSDVCKSNEDKSCRVSTGRQMGCSSEDGLDGMCKEVDGNIECFCKHNDCHLNGTTIEKWRDYVRRNSSLNHSTVKFENSLHAKNLTVTNCGDNHCWGGKDKSCQMTIHKNGTDCQLECSSEGSLQDDCVLSSDNTTTHCYCREDDCHQKKSTIENWIDKLNLTRNQTIEKLDTCLHVKGSLVKSCGGVRCEDGKRFLSCKIEVGTDGSNCVVGCSEEDGPANECTTKNNTIQCLCRKNNCDKDKRVVGQWKSSFGENGLTPFLHGCLHRLHPTTIRPLRTVGPKVVKQSNFTGQTLKDLQGRLAAAKQKAQPLVQQKEDGGFTFKWWYIFLIVALLVTIGLFGVVIWSAATRKKRCEKYWKAREEEEKKKKAAAAAAAQKMRQMSKEAEMEVLSEKDIIKKGPHHLQSKFKGDMKHLRDNQKSESIHDKVEFVPQLNEEVEIGSDVEVIDGMEQQSYAETMSVSRIDNFNTVRQVSSTASIQN